jgi:hypothetical protein
MRTTEEQVRALAGLPDSIHVLSYMEMATAIVDDLVKYAKGKLDDPRLELIERNLSAHYAQVSGASTASSVTSKAIAGASSSFNRGNPQAVTGTPYGLTAVQLDTTRCLVGIMEGPVQAIWLGTSR